MTARIQTVMMVDDSFNYCTRFNTNYRALLSTIIGYHQLSYSLDMFKFDTVVDDNFFFRLNERVNDSFSVGSFAKDGLKPKWQMVKW